jgi:hypothetical protein
VTSMLAQRCVLGVRCRSILEEFDPKPQVAYASTRITSVPEGRR